MAIIATYTPNYKLAAFLGDSEYNPSKEFQRWTTVDNTLTGVSNLIGDGIVEGWEVTASSSGLDLYIATGTGFINKWFVKSDTQETLTLNPNTEYYISVGVNTNKSFYDQSVYINYTIATYVNSILLAKCVTDDTKVASINMSYDIRKYAGVDNKLLKFLNTHEHDGLGTPNSAPKINLQTDVSGVLSASYIGDIDSSKIIGNIPLANLPAIPHQSLLDAGNYTHSAIDAFMSQIDYQTIGEIALTNSMQESITMLHAFPSYTTIKNLINEREIIPGLTGTTCIDTFNSTVATINTIGHYVQGTYAATITPVVATRMWSGKLGDYGFLNPNNTVSNLEMNLTKNDQPVLHLKKTGSLDKYYKSGYLIVDFDANLIANWKSISIDSISDTTYPLYIKYQTSGDTSFSSNSYTSNQETLVFNNTQYSSPIAVVSTTNYLIDLSNLNDNRYLRIRFDFNSSADFISTPYLNKLTLNYDTTVDSQKMFSKYNTKQEFESASTYSNIDTYTYPGSVVLQRHTQYYPTGVFLSTYIDGSPSLVRWNKLYTDYYEPYGSNISWTVRCSTTIGGVESSSWSYPTYINGLYDVSDQKYRFMQLKSNLSIASYSTETPEILEAVLTGINQIPTITGTCVYYKRWTLSNSLVEGFNPAQMNNVTPTYYTNAVTVDDKTIKTSYWESAWSKLDSNWRQLKNLYIYGENFAKENIDVLVRLSENPNSNVINEIPALGTISPITIDLSSYSTTNFITPKDMYIQIKTTLKSNIGN